MKTLSQMKKFIEEAPSGVSKPTFLDRVREFNFDGSHWAHQRCLLKLKMASLAVSEEDLDGDE